MANVTEKYCTRCKTSKPTTLFHTDKSRIDGITANCRSCRVEMSQRWSRRKVLARNPKFVPRKIKGVSLIDRFESHIYKSIDGCWYWTSVIGWGGYGLFQHKHKTQSAHRAAYTLYKGKIPDGLQVCHECDNPPCCNPHHLWLGTSSDNAKDAFHKGRRKQPQPKRLQKKNL